MKNPMGKTVKLENAYKTFRSIDGQWEWKVLKSYQLDDTQEYARRYTAVKSPFTYDSYEYGDNYVKDVVEYGIEVK